MPGPRWVLRGPGRVLPRQLPAEGRSAQGMVPPPPGGWSPFEEQAAGWVQAWVPVQVRGSLE